MREITVTKTFDKISKIDDVRALIDFLNDASKAYYNTGHSIISDWDFDKKMEQLEQMESELGFKFSNSPTRNVGAEILNELPKSVIDSKYPMLSLNKKHTVQEVLDFISDNDSLIMLKMDGLSVRLVYNNGELISANTRGNGIEGSDILHHVKVFQNVPLNINYKGKLIIDGESIIKYDDFNKINEQLIANGEDEYSHPRMLSSGSLTSLDNTVVKERKLHFYAWRVIEGFDDVLDELHSDSNLFKLLEAKSNGFTITPYISYSPIIDFDQIADIFNHLKNKAKILSLPIDGIVIALDSISKGLSLGRTEKFFKHSIAYKFEDEVYETTLRDIEWSMGKTGELTPIAIFDTVVIDNTNISRAQLHTLGCCTDLQLGIGDKIEVAKANCIIPIIKENKTRSFTFEIPKTCPICGAETDIECCQEDNYGIGEHLYCTNYNCRGKLLGKLTHFVSKDAMNISGLSKSTLKVFMDKGWLNNFIDIYKLKEHKLEMYNLDGFGKTSVDKLLDAIERSKETTMFRFINAISIPQIGKVASKLLDKQFGGDIKGFMDSWKNGFDFTTIEGIGVMTDIKMHEFIKEHYDMLIELINIFNFAVSYGIFNTVEQVFKDKNICITGALNIYKNRNELVEDIEKFGGKVCSSVSKNTHYLLTNDTTSGSSKNIKAKQLGIPIITEEEFRKKIGV